MKLTTKHMLTIRDISGEEVLGLVDRAAELKQGWKQGDRPRPLADKSVALIFQKASTRTRVSFEVGIRQLGGNSLFMPSRDTQIDRAEPLADTARVLSRYVDCLVVRTFGQEIVDELARHGSIPVVNALTDLYHPCQVLSDLLTVREHLGSIEDQVYCWIGDGNNMAHSWLEAAAALKAEIRLACPEGFEPKRSILEHARKAGANVFLTRDPKQAADRATVISTDVWASMGQEGEADSRAEAFFGYTVDQDILAVASPDSVVMHCLPAHRGEEITEEVLEGEQSVVWDQAENRLHMQKAILEALVG